jgi:serine/threonine protein phosphatase 1
MEVVCEAGKIGIVHADVPVGISWQKLVHGIHFDNEMRDYLMWSRNRYKYIQLTGETERVEGIDLVVMGHTPIPKALQISNLYYIDTGASYLQEEDLGHLTILQIHPVIKPYVYPEPLE